MTEKSEEMEKSEKKRDCAAKLKSPLRLIKILFYVLCICGLAYQLTTLVIQYTQYKTNVNLQFETIKYNRMPAITICYPEHISMNKTAIKYPQMQPIFDEYKNLLVNVSKDDYYNETFQYTLNSIYDEFVKFVQNQTLPVVQYYDLMFDYKFSQNTSLFLSEKISRSIDVELYGLRRFEDGTIEEFNITDTHPIQTRFAYRNCFTFNSHMNKTLRQYQMEINNIKIRIYHHEDWFPPTIYEKRFGKLSFSMHSPNEFPHSAQMFDIKMGYRYDKPFGRWKIKLLEAPYETNCFRYNLDNIKGYQMYSECLQHCYEETMHKVCTPCKGQHYKCCFATSSKVWPIEWIKKYNYDHLKYCPFNKCFSLKRNSVTNKCKETCRPECTNRYYLVTERENANLTLHRNWDKYTYIRLSDNKMPDQVTEHTEQMTFIDFFGIFGGVFGIWLGLSVIALFDYLMKYVE